MTKNFGDKFWPFTFYFLFFASVASLSNFLALFFEEKGLPGTQIGILMALSSLTALFVGPLWSGLADATRRHHLVLAVAIIGNAIAYLSFPFFEDFWWFFVLITLGALFSAPIIPLADNATMSMLGKDKKKYGRIRLGGTFGFLFASLLIGIIVERYGLPWAFWIYSTVLFITLIAVPHMRFRRSAANGSFLKGVQGLLTDRKWIVFLAIVLIAGSGNAVINSYLFVYFKEIGITATWMGLANSIATVAEIPALFFANHLLKKFKPSGMLTLGLVATAVRCILYGMIGIPWMALTVQLLQAVTFPILLVAGVAYADEKAPPGMGTTAQSIFGSAFMSVGFAAGGFFGGLLLEYIGVQPMFLVFGALILLAALAFVVLQRVEPAARPT
jgi:MFS transporter, PPP family, 3-phenylpropionic acid transporter